MTAGGVADAVGCGVAASRRGQFGESQASLRSVICLEYFGHVVGDGFDVHFDDYCWLGGFEVAESEEERAGGFDDLCVGV